MKADRTFVLVLAAMGITVLVLGGFGLYGIARVVAAFVEKGSYAEHYDQARGLYEQQRYQEALTEIDKAIALRPHDPYALYCRALTYACLGDHLHAAADLDATERYDPQGVLRPDVLYARGWEKSNQGQWQPALAQFDRALALRRDARVLQARASAYDALGREDQAISDISSCIAMDGRNPDAYRARASFYDRAGRSKEAAADGLREAELRGDDAVSWSNAGWWAYKAGDLRSAIALTDRALKLKPNLPVAALNKGLYYACLGSRDRMRSAYQSVLSRAGSDDLKGGLDDVAAAQRKHPDNRALLEARALIERAAKQ